MKNLVGDLVFVPYETEVNFKVLGAPDAKLEIARAAANYIAKVNTSASEITLQLQYLPKAFVRSKVFLKKESKFLQLNYKLWTSAPESYSKIAYPEKIKPFKVTERHKLEVELLFANPHTAPNNTFLVLQSKVFSKARLVHHLDPETKKVLVNFEKINIVNGEFELKVIAKSENVAEWLIGDIMLDLSSESSEFTPAQIKGPLKGKEIMHVFAPELVYAPIIVSAPISVLLVVMLFAFLTCIFKLSINCNNWPEIVYGKFHAVIFIVRTDLTE
eukprot:TRINITY_DN2805_c0_g2_i1.p1 TRINITY_DN2805_c0_g2~~TRINITY_DN2805_c0_g2_i1.p1  ORF type:complete len:273 (-),score=53.57 TRINITY_DN2805_c0_g2_i1:164-982(-)